MISVIVHILLVLLQPLFAPHHFQKSGRIPVLWDVKFGNVSAAPAEIKEKVLHQSFQLFFILIPFQYSCSTSMPPKGMGQMAEIIFKITARIIASRCYDRIGGSNGTLQLLDPVPERPKSADQLQQAGKGAIIL